jgi:hypothetical protein
MRFPRLRFFAFPGVLLFLSAYDEKEGLAGLIEREERTQ